MELFSQQRSIVKILMLPWLAHGHISPFLELAKKLTKRNFHIILCSTPVNLESVKPKLSEKYSQSIELVELHLPADEFPDLPPHYHTTNGLPPHLMPTLKTAFDMASTNFSKILKTLNPDLLIYDFLQPWAPALALAQNIPAVEFFTTSAAMYSFYLGNRNPPPSVGFPFPAIYLRDYEMANFNKLLTSSSNGVTDGDRVNKCNHLSCEIILIKTSRVIEAKYVDYLAGILGKRFVPVGPLVQEPADQKGDEETSIVEWLSTKERSSVVYVSFGSEYFLSREEIQEIAHGLELSEVNFVWVIRFPVGETRKVDDVLPGGFVGRVGDKGMIVEGWAPQAKILKHSSVGGFVSHCGWSSVLEGIKFGVPIIAVPMHLDQPINARLVEEVGVGVGVVKSSTGRLRGDEVAKAVRDVVEKKGEGLKRRAVELSEGLKKTEDEEMDEVVEELMQLCTRMDSK